MIGLKAARFLARTVVAHYNQIQLKQITSLAILLIFSLSLFSEPKSNMNQGLHSKMKSMNICFLQEQFIWPSEYADRPFKIGVVQDRALYEDLSKFAAKGAFSDRIAEFSVEMLDSLPENRFFHILYVPYSADYIESDLFNALGSWPTLLVTDGYDYNTTMLNFFLVRGEKLDRQVNLFNIERQGLQLKDEFKKAYPIVSVEDWQKRIEYFQGEIEVLELDYNKSKSKLNRVTELLENQRGISAIAMGIGLIILILGILAFRNYIKQKSQAMTIGLQHDQLKQKNNEILDSIQYAKRIQNAILPPKKLVLQYLDNSFILYKPKDMVAGDFYWMEPIGNSVFFAAADCTGHGVPGAMVSVVCVNGLNRSVREFGLTDPGRILDKTRELVIKEFEKSEEEVKDGMDIALCHLDGKTLKYAGANNPLWIIRNGEIIETKGDKQPIGKYSLEKPFISHTVELHQGDTVYLFSDGYVDQFGGKQGKKFKSKALRELLLSVQDKTMEEQRIIIDEAFEAWRGDNEQIDDVCMIGVRI